MTDDAGLLERGEALARVSALIAEVQAGEGRALMIEGPAGIGKSSLLEASAGSALAAGFTVLKACGEAQEHSLAFGVVRQLFERALFSRPAADRELLLAGAAAPAAVVVDATHAAAGHLAGGDDRVAEVTRGLHWLTVNLAAPGPLLLIIDDLHWADTASQRWLAYLARRLDGITVLLALGIRTGEPDPPPYIPAPRLELGALSVSGTARVLRAVFGQEVHPRLSDACHAATGGNPFYVRELARELVRTGVRPGADAAPVAKASPRAVSHAVVERLAHLPSGASSLARAIAVLGTRADLRHAAALAQLDPARAARLASALESAGLLRPGTLQFDHPIVRAVVYDDIPVSERALEHGRAARLLADEGADVMRIASHLMITVPLGAPDVVRHLRDAARVSLDSGAPDEAAAYLTRALAEPPPYADRAELLRELGGAELIARASTATEHLREAMSGTSDAVERGRIAMQLAEAVGFAGHMAEARVITSQALEDLGDRDAALTARLEAQRARNDTGDGRFATEVEERFDVLRARAARAGPAGRELLLCLAFNAASRGAPVEQVLELVDLGLDDGRYTEQEGADALGVVTAAVALAYVDALPAADRLLMDMRRAGRARGAVVASMAEDGWGGYIRHRCGELQIAEVQSRAALTAASDHGQQFIEIFSRGFLAETLIARGDLAEAAELLAPDIFAGLHGTVGEMYVQLARGRLELARGHSSDAVGHLRACAATCEALRLRNPNIAPWRSLLAVAIGPTDRDQARELVDEEMTIAGRVGQARGIGAALHATGLVEDGERRISLLRDAAAVLEDSPARVERATVLADLGTALRRGGLPVEAREPLARALDLAHASGARPLAERTIAELRIAGARPRRPQRSGVGALTANEHRVVSMAAEGLSNPEIATMLFIARKTVEKHLSVAYRKLGVAGRNGLPGALDQGPPVDPGRDAPTQTFSPTQ